ncbi:hypothetical protein HYFRA_00008189 [Hymenoscyphus fraxineus]|uniref:Major facilitator superfamily (MFS) profile domain-containing protein n=1 Tax=Hymenoscyphus fraxineus TaxID=746836 RepID=A0A9N9PYK6_9HELO|nr:hypothetical protein HYFRA_00008189 [Hymenoscyphus fraxineus]
MGLSFWKQFLNTAQIRCEYSEKPTGLRWRSNKVFIVATVGIGLFTDLFLYGLIVPILPFFLSDGLNLPPDQVQRHVSLMLAAYAAASVCMSLIAGVLTDRLSSRRTPFLLGVTALFGATLLLFLGRTIWVLLVARVLQGFSAAVVWTTGMALCLETVGAENLGKAIGAIFGFISVGTFLAPILGGLLYDKGGLAAVFGLACAILAVDFTMRLLVIEVRTAQRYEREDENGTDSLITGASESQPLIEEGNDELSSLLQNVGKADEDDSYRISPDLPKIMRIIPILPCLAAPRLIAALTIAFVQALLLGSIDATVPIVSHEYYNFSPLQAGLMFLPIGVANLTAGPFLGWCVDKLGTKKISVLVYLYLVPVLISFRFAKPGGASQVAVYEILLGLLGIGVAGMGAPSIVEASMVVQKYHQVNPDFFGDHGPYAQLYSLSFLFFSLGLVLGPELAGELRQAIGYGNMNAVLATVCALTSLVCFQFIGEKRK